MVGNEGKWMERKWNAEEGKGVVRKESEEEWMGWEGKGGVMEGVRKEEGR